MIKILFVCTGNICRSPLAEGILREKLSRNDVTAHIDSCGFESFHVGDPPDIRAQKVALERGIDISLHRARLFTIRDFERFDYIYAMDSSHFNKIIGMARNETDKSKVDYMLNVLYPGQNRSVIDPWYHDLKAFDDVYRQLDEACELVVKKIIADFQLK